MQNKKYTNIPRLAIHFSAVLLIFFILCLIRYPIFINSDHFFTGDEGLLGGTILKLLNGGPTVFYYPTAKTFGLTNGLVASPFIWFFGPTSLAYNIPATIFYSLYLYTTYLIARILIPRTAYIVFIMLFFTPNYVTHLSTHNWAHIPAAFLGNLIFLLFLKIKLSKENNQTILFFIFFIMGFAIYTYTYSLIYILTISILYALTHPNWVRFREIISPNSWIVFFKNKKTKMEILCSSFDIIIILFTFAVVFSYVFGGFAFDIAGHSILQINKFHKAAMQLFALLFIRILINPKSAISFYKILKSYLPRNPQSKNQNIIAVAGFLIGLSPRIASIITGETSRGGQGHDTDFLPTKLFIHFLDILTKHGPEILGFNLHFTSFNSNTHGNIWHVFIFLFVLLIAIYLTSAFSLISENFNNLKNIFTLKTTSFKPILIFLLLPFLVCAANTIVQNGAQARYLFPLFGVATLWIGVFVDKIKTIYKWFPSCVLIIWVCFYSLTNFYMFNDIGIIKENKVVKLKKHPIHDLVDFLLDNKITAAYSNAETSLIGFYFSDGKININEFSSIPLFNLKRREKSFSIVRFAIIATKYHADTYLNYLKEKGIKYKTEIISDYKIFWDFSGNNNEINKLRSLITY